MYFSVHLLKLKIQIPLIYHITTNQFTYCITFIRNMSRVQLTSPACIPQRRRVLSSTRRYDMKCGIRSTIVRHFIYTRVYIILLLFVYYGLLLIIHPPRVIITFCVVFWGKFVKYCNKNIVIFQFNTKKYQGVSRCNEQRLQVVGASPDSNLNIFFRLILSHCKLYQLFYNRNYLVYNTVSLQQFITTSLSKFRKRDAVYCALSVSTLCIALSCFYSTYITSGFD